MARAGYGKRLISAVGALGSALANACPHEWKPGNVQIINRKGHRGRVGTVVETCALCGDRRMHYGTLEKAP